MGFLLWIVQALPGDTFLKEWIRMPPVTHGIRLLGTPEDRTPPFLDAVNVGHAVAECSPEHLFHIQRFGHHLGYAAPQVFFLHQTSE
jgi:hypothetical protein